MTLTELKYIIALQETGHFGRAAEKCFVSQPTLSVAIKKLEDDLGISLFERSRGKIQSTPVGKQVVQQAKVVLKQASHIRELANQGRDPLGTPLAIGAIHTVGPYLYPRCIPLIREYAPDMPLYIEENLTGVLREKLRSSKLDAIIVALPFNETDVVTQALYEEPFVVLLPYDHPLSSKSELHHDDLIHENILLLGEGHCFRDQVMAACPGLQQTFANGDRLLQSVVEGSSLETLKHMVVSKLGITILPRSAAQVAPYGDGILCTRPFATPPTRTVALAWRTSFPRHQAIDIVSKAIKAAVPQLSVGS
ncbi:Hydrogen peroxide-inducible genes activator [Zhongshania aliphaticivorans]|uniref:Hydrogen peroxide-inducible genes activator n=1 Tax=Zhongshania aliphaticivorans TaxID=1470434 RepID=A0A5S9Q910_9GAMM|nr:hydrogen peroxide-inducible genes activator [Zhongshania aliphaticivorans]CAA0102746.1 Hydrogen peroxide-inducible genes activator [Zhongshania aliphaticivorans]CAA0113936.1 Hydrogen peroxide-inducible genes activator [Zhongshania aliphaticivorans]